MDDGQGFSAKLKKLIRSNALNDEEVLEEDEAEMMSNVMEFSDTETSEIMTIRTKIDAVSTDETIESALKFMLVENHTRYPLYEDSIDNIKGVLYIKDLMIEYMAGNGDKPVSVAAREAIFVPESMPVDTLFETLRSKRTHIAIVVDEYGQTSGIVGMEDIIEEIVGDIFDEYDEVEKNFSVGVDGAMRLSGEMRLDELEETAGLKVKEEDLEDFETLNGLLVSLLGHIPEKGEKAVLEYNGNSFKIFSKTGRVITDILVSGK